jgi:outer membrane PBP1 activator LpoA protein
MPRLTRELPALLAAVVLAFGAAGCGEEDVENAGQDASESIEQNSPEAREAAEDAGTDAENAAERAAQEAEENAPEARDQAEDALNEAEQQLEEETR